MSKEETVKDLAITRAAAELHMSESHVRVIVNTFDAARNAVTRVRKGQKVKPKALKGGWYLMPDGKKVQGKKAAGLDA